MKIHQKPLCNRSDDNMVRMRSTIAILIALIALVIYSNWLVHHVTQTMVLQLEEIQIACNSQNYKEGTAKIKELREYYKSKEHLLALFIKRDYLGSVGVSIWGLSAYSQQENLQDLNSEINKTKAQLMVIEHLFFSML